MIRDFEKILKSTSIIDLLLASSNMWLQFCWGTELADRDSRERYNRIGRVQPIVFVVSDKVIINLAMIWAALPMAFIVFKVAGVQLISAELADQLVDGISLAWPVLSEQYEAIKQLRLWLDAANYSLFVFLLAALTAFSVLYIIVRFFACRNKINRPAKIDFFFVLVGISCSIYALFFDRVREKPFGFHRLYIDTIGSYYIRQWIVVSGIWFTLVVTTILILQFLSSLKRPS